MNIIHMYYRSYRKRKQRATAQNALERAREFAGKWKVYEARLREWEAEPDKRRYAPGGVANRPKAPDFPQLAQTPFDHMRMCANPQGEQHWYCDAFQDNVLVPVVARLPGGKFLAGWKMQDTSVYGTFHVHEDEGGAWSDASYSTESKANAKRIKDERYLEAERAYDARFEARQAIKEVRSAFHELAQELKQETLLPHTCALLRREMESLYRKVQHYVREIREMDKVIRESGMAADFN